MIIPAYEAEEYVDRAILSVAASAPNGTEVVVVDDGSGDRTVDVVQQTRHRIVDDSGTYNIRLVRHPENRGKAAAINTALRVVRGRLIGVLDADDEYEREGLATLYEAATGSEKSRVMVIGGFRVVDELGATIGVRSAPSTSDAIALRRKVAFGWRTPFHFNASLVAASLYRDMGALDVDAGRVVDIDMSLRLLNRARCVRCVEQPVYRYRKHRMKPSQRVAVRLRTTRLRYRVVRRNFPGFAGWVGAAWMTALDGLKLLFELFGNYSS